MKTISQVSDLEALTTPELLETYNELTGATVKRFSDRKSALRRTTEAWTEAQELAKHPSREAVEKEEAAASAPSDTPKPKQTRKAKGALAVAPKRPQGYNRPAQNWVRECRPTSAKGKLLELLLRGATLAQAKKATDFDDKHLHTNLLTIHTWLGYGLRQAEDGTITAFRNPNAKTIPNSR